MICCGKPMRLKGGKYVCAVCKAWFIPGLVLAFLTRKDGH
jgi:hypothetical protein